MPDALDTTLADMKQRDRLRDHAIALRQELKDRPGCFECRPYTVYPVLADVCEALARLLK